MGRIPGAERIPKPWVWAAFFGYFLLLWEKSTPPEAHDKRCGAWGMRIATASVRTGFAMTGVLARSAAVIGWADVGIGPYGCIARSIAKRGVEDAAPYGCVTRSAV